MVPYPWTTRATSDTTTTTVGRQMAINIEEDYPDWYKQALQPEPVYEPEDDIRRPKGVDSAIYNSQPKPPKWWILLAGYTLEGVGNVIQGVGYVLTGLGRMIANGGKSLTK